ncbi:unnamed protein product [Paramecium octaurelia]|uniref:Uncharacterized protein n=1 Tax=Paramecium octaurelia TaxID=43137 RepID=A0A8S1SD96_PAROT|nr:unnamed protein product [Paramecium octaurelia]
METTYKCSFCLNHIQISQQSFHKYLCLDHQIHRFASKIIRLEKHNKLSSDKWEYINKYIELLYNHYREEVIQKSVFISEVQKEE